MQLRILTKIKSGVASYVIAFVGCLLSLGFCLPAMAAGSDLDVTINVVGPGQDIQGVIDHDIALPRVSQMAPGVLIHKEHEHAGLEVHSAAGGEMSDISHQGLSDSQESASMEQQTQELMNQAQQTDQSVQDKELDTD